MNDATNTPTVAEHVELAIRDTVGILPAETGGVLGRHRDSAVITHFHFDTAANRTGATYSPDTRGLKLLLDAWHRRRVDLVGFVHSHPPGFRRPSGGDTVYCKQIFAANPKLQALDLPIVMSEADVGSFEIHWFRMRRNGTEPSPVGAQPIVVPARTEAPLVEEAQPSIRIALPAEIGLDDGTFARVGSAYDLARLTVSRVIVVGVGGAAGWVEDLAKAGVGEFVLDDPDTVSVTNLATQHVYDRADIGRYKVQCLARRIRAINPKAVVMTIAKPVEALSDADFYRLAFAPARVYRKLPATISGSMGRATAPVDVRLRPAMTMVCAMTDNFPAQARVARLALQFGLPFLAAQVYARGRGLELVFSYPGVTPACPRCLLRPRYDAYLSGGFSNDVTSDGTPIFSTTRLNGLKGLVAMAMLHHGTEHPRWGPMLGRIANRNLIQVRCDPDLELRIFEHAFQGADRSMLFCDESLFIPRKPVPGCEDCGGTGDLRSAIGKFLDTRV